MHARSFTIGITLLAVACGGDDDISPTRKAAVDVDALTEGVEIAADDDISTVSVPLLEPLADASREEVSRALQDAVFFMVTNDASGISAELAAGELVLEGEPEEPGQWSWSAGEERLSVVLTFNNETSEGTSIAAGEAYTASLEVLPNPYLRTIDPFAFPVMITTTR